MVTVIVQSRTSSNVLVFIPITSIWLNERRCNCDLCPSLLPPFRKEDAMAGVTGSGIGDCCGVTGSGIGIGCGVTGSGTAESGQILVSVAMQAGMSAVLTHPETMAQDRTGWLGDMGSNQD
jgi:hypothetical protein